MRVHLAKLAERGDLNAQATLAAVPPLPPHGAHLWSWFLALSRTRGSSGFGPASLTRLEIQAWERDEFIRLKPWERAAILQMDQAWLRAQAEAMKPKETA